jgi:hypothetical protein
VDIRVVYVEYCVYKEPHLLLLFHHQHLIYHQTTESDLDLLS